jgi:hypothetical protein
MSAPYALFDPHSACNALRATLVPHEKIRGYFYWRRTRRGSGEERHGPSPERPPLVFRGGAPPTPLKARVTIPDTDSLPDRYRIEVTLLETSGLPDRDAPCRAFLVEQGVLDRLRAGAAPAVVCREGDLLTLRDLYTAEVRTSVSGGSSVRLAAVLDEQSVALRSSSGEVRLWDTVRETLRPAGEGSEAKISWGGDPGGAEKCLAAWTVGIGIDGLLYPPPDGARFIEPLACGPLRPALVGNDERALAQLFDHRLLSEDFAVQQAVSALPELEGRLQGDRIVLEAAIPPGCPNISDRTWVVVVIDWPAA